MTDYRLEVGETMALRALAAMRQGKEEETDISAYISGSTLCVRDMLARCLMTTRLSNFLFKDS